VQGFGTTDSDRIAGLDENVSLLVLAPRARKRCCRRSLPTEHPHRWREPRLEPEGSFAIAAPEQGQIAEPRLLENQCQTPHSSVGS
jgi:hypothetical protein